MICVYICCGTAPLGAIVGDDTSGGARPWENNLTVLSSHRELAHATVVLSGVRAMQQVSLVLKPWSTHMCVWGRL